MLDYTLQRMIEKHALVIERDIGVADAFGAESSRSWQILSTTAGKFWWWAVHGRGAFDENVDPRRDVNTTGGGALLPLGTDVTENDRIREVLEGETVIVKGPLRITSVRESDTHIELSLERP